MPKFIRLTDYKSSEEKEKGFFDPKNRYTAKQKDFSKIPGSPIAYWVSEKIFESFNKIKKIHSMAIPRAGMITGNNNYFVKYWFELQNSKIGYEFTNIFDATKSKYKWFPYQKGGSTKKWYGNNEFVVIWENGGSLLKNTKDINGKIPAHAFNEKYIFTPNVNWSAVTSGLFTVRITKKGFLFDAAGSAAFPILKDNLLYLSAFLNSKIANYFLGAINPTINYQAWNIGNLPIKIENLFKLTIDRMTQQNIDISKQEWDSRETSWDFKMNELIRLKSDNGLLNSYNAYCDFWKEQFFTLHKNEEELNRLFIDIYDLADEITPDVDLKDITILKTEAKIVDNELIFQKGEIIKQLLSYALGCFMGRYRLDKPGLHIAHPAPTDEEISPYLYKGKEFEIDDDAIIPLMGSNCGFSDDIVYRVKSFIELVWGEETLTENINFIEDALGKDIEKYLINDIWKYHIKMYKKKPIYWLFSSPKGAFKVVVYMHRMNRFTVQKIRNNYLLPHINYLSREIESLKNRELSLNKEETNRLTKLLKDELECKDYEKLVKDFADRQIEFDLDDGVTVNYKKFEGIVEKIK